MPEAQQSTTPAGKRVYERTGTGFGTLTGGSRHCTLEGCNGRRLGVRWPDGKLSWPCTKGMRNRPDGAWQIG